MTMMSRITRALALALALAPTAGCTVLAASTAASLVATHNTFTDDRGDWHYGIPMLVGAAVGLCVDVAYLVIASRTDGNAPLD